MKGFTVWITGLPGSGKSELGQALAGRLVERGRSVEVIDSGALRGTPLASSLGFSRAERVQNNRRHAFAAKLLSRNGVVAIVTAVSPYRDTRDAIREELERFVEVYVSTPKAACIDRDDKGVWRKALAGEIRDFTGVDDPYEPPLEPEFRFDISSTDPAEGASQLIRALVRLEHLTGTTSPGVAEDPLRDQLEGVGFSE
ncbi:MAG TPA: adenylyl-sulfate kinase [Myxococcota bacterium]|nr:adenylyl-sulfate kinase [Myxococcota bacterium]